MVTAPLKWRSQLCPCGFCPDGTRIEWRYSIDIRFRPRQRKPPSETNLKLAEIGRRMLEREKVTNTAR